MTHKTQTDSIDKVDKYNFKYCFSLEVERLKGVSGVYSFWRGSKLEYIGVSGNLGSRIKTSYKQRYETSTSSISMKYIPANISDAHILEIYLICTLNPKKNITGKTKEKPTININHQGWSDSWGVSGGCYR
tara:strand:- start:2446 stop:2838 length:393 start_codon:yes stop_codon:yes gene_type:complete